MGAPARIGIVARAVGAVAGGYAVAASLSMALARWLPGAAAEAVVWAMLAGVLAFPTTVIWAFAARSAVRAWGGIGLVVLVAASLFLLGGRS